MEIVTQALAQYGASLDPSGAIVREGKTTGVRCRVRAGRVRFEFTSTGILLASGTLGADAVETFVESFWFWEK